MNEPQKQERYWTSDPIQVRAALRELHRTLTMDRLLSALKSGLAQRANVTDHHPANYAGSVMYGETTRSMRDIFIPLEWTKDSTKNFETTVSPDALIAIVVASGDDVGNLSKSPTTRHEKGTVTRRLVRQNRQARLVFDQSAAAANKKVFSREVPVEEYQLTWFLLHRVIAGELRSELSHPTEIDENGQICEWSHRLILTSIPLESDSVSLPEDPIEPIVDVRRRAI